MSERKDKPKTYKPAEWDETDAVWHVGTMTNRGDTEAAYKTFCEQGEPWNAYKASAVHWQEEAERYRNDANRAEDYNRKPINEIKSYRDRAERAEREAEVLRKKLAEQQADAVTAQQWWMRFVRDVKKMTVTFRNGEIDDELF